MHWHLAGRKVVLVDADPQWSVVRLAERQRALAMQSSGAWRREIAKHVEPLEFASTSPCRIRWRSVEAGPQRDARAELVTRVLADLFEGPVVVVASSLSLADDELFAEERAHVQAAVAKRRAEFATARVLARRALAALGAPPVALVPAPDRAPVWPPGYVGSISHCADHCAVAVARSRDVSSLGLDVEDLRELDPSMRDLVLTPAERRWLRAQPDALQPMLPIVIFSAKEAYYKCQYPITHGFLDFQDVELTIAWAAGTFEARVEREGWPAVVARLAGRFLIADGRVSCGVTLAKG